MTDTRGRPARQDEVRQERRRRDDATLDGMAAKKLAIPDHVAKRLADEGLTPRWINDEGNRIHNLSVRDDYDKVDGVEPLPVGTTKEGKPIMAHLFAKRSDFIAEDRAKKDAHRRDMENAMLTGAVPGDNPTPATVQTYADKANRIERGNQNL